MQQTKNDNVTADVNNNNCSFKMKNITKLKKTQGILLTAYSTRKKTKLVKLKERY